MAFVSVERQKNRGLGEVIGYAGSGQYTWKNETAQRFCEGMGAFAGAIMSNNTALPVDRLIFWG